MNKALYQALILDHNKNPHNFGRLNSPTSTSEGYNPLCGDKYIVDVEIADGMIKKIAFEGSGCALSKASASLMTEAVLEKNTKDVKQTISKMQELITTGKSDIENKKLQVFSNVKDYPTRAKCASLPWHTLKAVLAEQKIATTE